MPSNRYGSWEPNNVRFSLNEMEDVGGPSPGGVVVRMTAGATLNVGDCVYVSAALTVNKATGAGAGQQVVGIVVGGKATYGQCYMDKVGFGTIPAAAVNEDVFVQVSGIAWAVADNTAILAGSRIAASSTTAGRIRLATDLVIAAGAVAVTSAAANGAGTISGDGIDKTIGIALEANGGVAGTVILVLLK